MEKIKAAYRRFMAVDPETPMVVKFIRRGLGGSATGTVLDVGCGHGRYLRALRQAGIPATGVDVNPEIVERNCAAGFECLTPEEFGRSGRMVDVILMSHVVEHFAPAELLRFMDTYLRHLRPGGHLVIATPLLGPRFFDDFDHVRPYQPLGFSMVFGGPGAQVQYQGAHRLELVDLWFRRSPQAVSHARGLYVRSSLTRLLQLANLAGVVTFRVTGGLLGRTTGWVGLFRKD